MSRGFSVGLARQVTPTERGTQPDGSWTFTDSRVRTIKLPDVPKRIFADAGAALALWELGSPRLDWWVTWEPI